MQTPLLQSVTQSPKEFAASAFPCRFLQPLFKKMQSLLRKAFAKVAIIAKIVNLATFAILEPVS